MTYQQAFNDGRLIANIERLEADEAWRLLGALCELIKANPDGYQDATAALATGVARMGELR